MSLSLQHTLISTSNTVKRVSQSSNGTLYYTKSTSENSSSISGAGNTCAGGKYYDYSNGYTLSTMDDLNTPGVKTITVSYIPGYGLAPLTGTVYITVTPTIPVTGMSLDTASATDPVMPAFAVKLPKGKAQAKFTS